MLELGVAPELTVARWWLIPEHQLLLLGSILKWMLPAQPLHLLGVQLPVLLVYIVGSDLRRQLIDLLLEVETVLVGRWAEVNLLRVRLGHLKERLARDLDSLTGDRELLAHRCRDGLELRQRGPLLHLWLLLLHLLLLHLGVPDQLAHVRTRLRHLQNLLLLLRDVRVEVVCDGRIEDRLCPSYVQHRSELILYCLELVHLRELLLLELLILEELLAFFQDIFPHLHRLLEVLVPVLQDLLQSLLVHADHLLLVLEHLAGLVLLLSHPVGLC